ncbi:hypothetical protein FB451DRAFT_700952 [Mycena latifolia]|nr:hypothetical protein FB451DRAFT_700952 [Mycena latifolia]
MNSRGRLTVRPASNTPTYAQTIPHLLPPTTTILHGYVHYLPSGADSLLPLAPRHPAPSSAFGNPLISSVMRLTASPMPFNSRLPMHLAFLRLLAASPVKSRASAPASTPSRRHAADNPACVVNLGAPASAPIRARRRSPRRSSASQTTLSRRPTVKRQRLSTSSALLFISPTLPSSRRRPPLRLRRPPRCALLYRTYLTFLAAPPPAETATPIRLAHYSRPPRFPLDAAHVETATVSVDCT